MIASAFSVRDAVLLWILFFLICFGLGYPILNRYDPGTAGGTSDAADYANKVRSPLSIMSYRPFVPALAKPFYWLAKGRVGSWNPALFGMLVATSILTAATALPIIAIGVRCGLSYVTSLVGAMLFLFNFAIPNWNLAAYVDSGEAFFLALVVWSLLSARWWLLLVWAIPGSLSKETFAPFAFVFAIVWWFTERPLRLGKLAWVAGLAILGGTTVVLSFSSPGSLFSGVTRYTLAMAAYSNVGFVSAFFRCLKAREFWYIFIWLLPLGVLRVKRLDHRWVWATAVTFLLALLFGAYNDALGNTARALFNISGPLLSLSVAVFLTDRQTRSAPDTSGQR
jgi:hypothetical protein